MAMFGKPRKQKRRKREGAKKGELGKGTDAEWKTVNKRLSQKYPRMFGAARKAWGAQGASKSDLAEINKRMSGK